MSSRAPAPEWAAISTDYFNDPDTGCLSPALQVAHIRLIVWTVRALTDGRVEPRHLPLTGVTRQQYRDLEAAGLIVDGHLRGWHKWQKPREAWQDEHSRRQFNGRLAMCQRWHEIDCRCLEGGPKKPKKGRPDG